MMIEDELHEQVKMTQEAIEIIKQLRRERDIAIKYLAIVTMVFCGNSSSVPEWKSKCSNALKDCGEIVHLLDMAKDELLDQ